MAFNHSLEECLSLESPKLKYQGARGHSDVCRLGGDDRSWPAAARQASSRGLQVAACLRCRAGLVLLQVTRGEPLEQRAVAFSPVLTFRRCPTVCLLRFLQWLRFCETCGCICDNRHFPGWHPPNGGLSGPALASSHELSALQRGTSLIHM